MDVGWAFKYVPLWKSDFRHAPGLLTQEWQCVKPPIVVGQIAWGLVLEQMDAESKSCQVPVDMCIFVFEIYVWNSNDFWAENFMPLKGQKQSIK